MNSNCNLKTIFLGLKVVSAHCVNALISLVKSFNAREFAKTIAQLAAFACFMIVGLIVTIFTIHYSVYLLYGIGIAVLSILNPSAIQGYEQIISVDLLHDKLAEQDIVMMTGGYSLLGTMLAVMWFFILRYSIMALCNAGQKSLVNENNQV